MVTKKMVTGNKISGSKNRISIKFIKLISLSLLVIMMIGSTSNVQGAVVWFDDFEDGNLDDWELFGWNDASGKNEVFAHGITITNGALKAPDGSSSATRSQAIKNSTTAIGTWSFDTIVNAGDTSEDASVFNFAFMFTELSGNYDISGLNSSEFQWTGYALSFVTISNPTGDFAGTTPEFARPGITLLKYDPNESSYLTVLQSHTLNRVEIVGDHHIDITRDGNGVISVYNDMVELFSLTDTTTNSSEKIDFTSWFGGTAIDNINVSDVVEAPIAPTTSPSTTSSTESSSSTTTTSESLRSSTTTSSNSSEDDSPISILGWMAPLLVIVIRRKFI